MTFLAPAFLLAALAVAAVVVALHFIVTREPRTAPLPTARFVPDRPVRAQSRAIRLQDLLLLVMRVALVLATGLALARPVLTPPRRAIARIVLADRSRAVADVRVVADSARALLRGGDALILFDSSATLLTEGTRDSLAALRRVEVRGRLSAGFVVALRAASKLREGADSLELVVVSPLVEEEFDAATDSIRALWPGRIRVTAVAPRTPSPRPMVGLVARADDPVRYALPDKAAPTSEATVRLVRDTLGPADSAWVTAGNRVLVHWPQFDPSGTQVDTVGAVVTSNAVVVAPFIRPVQNDAPGNASAPRVVAHWVDGKPAAVERPVGAGCVRSVNVPVPSRGDLVLQARFRALVDVLTEPCGGLPHLRPVNEAKRGSLVGIHATVRVAREAVEPTRQRTSPMARWLLILAIVLTAAEILVRRRMIGTAESAA